MEREGERVEIGRMCVLKRVSSNFYEDFSPWLSWKVMGIPWDFHWCACGVVVCDCCACCAVSPPIVSGFGENIFSESDCEFVES